MASAAALVNWKIPVFAQGQGAGEGEYDVIVIGAGLGGLSCAALFAMNGLRPLVLDKRDVPGGYATSFHRLDEQGDFDFTCETSLHAITGNPLSHVLLQQLGVWDKLIFAPHSSSWTSIFPDFSASFPQPPFELLQPFLQPPIDIESLSGQLDSYLNLVFFNQDLSVGPAGIYSKLVDIFPDEQEGLFGYMQCWRELLVETITFYSAEHGMPDDLTQFPVEYPTWASMLWKKRHMKSKTLDDLFKEYKIKNSQLKAILGQSNPYYGLPSSQIPAWFYLMNTGLYHAFGSFYLQGNPEKTPEGVELQGTSQDLSNLLVSSIRKPLTGAPGGEVLLNTEVAEIIINGDGRAVGVITQEGARYYANAVVSNASVPETFDKLLPASAVPATFTRSISRYQPSYSHVNVWLGVDLNLDIDDGFKDAYENLGSSTALYSSYDHDKMFQAIRKCVPEKNMIAVVAYDKLPSPLSHSPEGYASITLSMLCGYEPWEKFEDVYKNYYGDSEQVLSENVTFQDYRDEKEYIAQTMINVVEEKLLPGLSGRIIVQEKSSPLTNVRFTYNTGGAIYGYEQDVDNSGLNRLGNRTPVPGLYLSSAWTNPGGGFELVMLSGKEAVKCIIEDWTAAG
jgi:prolycopene isomerase